jgi:exonuclease SbcD
MDGKNSRNFGIMRVLYFADLHLGVETYGGVEPPAGKSIGLTDVFKALYEVVEYALGESVEVGG